MKQSVTIERQDNKFVITFISDDLPTEKMTVSRRGLEHIRDTADTVLYHQLQWQGQRWEYDA